MFLYQYQDIPLQEYMYVWNENICYGTNNDSIACQAQNTGLFAASKEQGDIKGELLQYNESIRR
jgi:hypothetical protein